MTIIYWTWCFPQTFIGWLYLALLILTGKKQLTRPHKNGTVVILYRGRSGVSLGKYLFVSNATMIAHEYGHSKQSLILGPLYLLVIGIPSVVWNILKSRGYFSGRSYYSFYTESWADRLGDVKR